MKGKVGDMYCDDSIDRSHSGCVQTICYNNKVFYIDLDLDRWTDTISISLHFSNVDKKECDYDKENVLEDIFEMIKKWIKEIVEK